MGYEVPIIITWANGTQEITTFKIGGREPAVFSVKHVEQLISDVVHTINGSVEVVVVVHPDHAIGVDPVHAAAKERARFGELHHGREICVSVRTPHGTAQFCGAFDRAIVEAAGRPGTAHGAIPSGTVFAFGHGTDPALPPPGPTDGQESFGPAGRLLHQPGVLSCFCGAVETTVDEEGLVVCTQCGRARDSKPVYGPRKPAAKKASETATATADQAETDAAMTAETATAAADQAEADAVSIEN
jgi:hypothetical protein